MGRQVRVLFRVFLSRFFENDLASDAGDFRLAFFALIALLAAPAIAAPILIATASLPGQPPQFGWIMTAHMLGVDALRRSVLSDKSLYLGYAMATSGLLSAIAWQSLLPDRRDARVLMPFGLHPRAAMTAKLLALFAYLGMAAVAIHALPSIVFGSLLAVDNTFAFALRGIAAHFVASVGASVFVGLLLVATQALLMSVLGPRRFTRASSLLHFAVVTISVTALALLPAASVRLGEMFRAGTALDGAGRWVPTAWFLGLYETIVGTANPAMRPLALAAVGSLAALVLVTVTLYPLVYRQMVNTALDEGVGHSRHASLAARFARVLSVLVARDQRSRAVAQFFGAALIRGARQRLVLALGAGASLALAMPAWLAASHTDVPPIHVGSFAWPIGTIAFLALALRLAAAMPVEEAGGWLLDLADVDPVRVRGVLLRTTWWLVIGPMLTASAIVYGRWWGPEAALTHVLVATPLAAAIAELALWHGVGLPCHGPWAMPVEQIRKWWPAFLIGGVFGIGGISGVEYLAMSSALAAGIAVAWWLGVAVAVNRGMRQVLRAPVAAAHADATIAGALRAASLGPLSGDDDPSRMPASEAPMFGAFQRPRRDEAWHDSFDLTPRGLWRDTRFALRRLLRAPLFTISAVAVLAVGISAVVTTLALLTTVTGQTSTIRDSARVFTIVQRQSSPLSRLDLEDLRARQTMFTAIEASSGFPSVISVGESTKLANGQLVTGGYFDLLGVRPFAGRLIGAPDDHAASARVVVLSEMFWQTSLNADLSVVGQTARIGGEPYTIVGIVPATFQMSLERGGIGFYVPFAQSPATDRGLTAYRAQDTRDVGVFRPVGRLRANATSDQAERQVFDIGRALDVSVPLGASGSPRLWSIRSAANAGLRTDSNAAFVFLLLPLSLFLIVTMSLANLVLSRSATRSTELAVRRALGASRASLVMEVVLELTAIAGVGGALAWVFARGAIAAIARYIESTFGQWPQYQLHVALNASDACWLALLVLIVVVMAGLIPAVRATAGSAWAKIGPAASSAAARWQGRSSVIATQVGLSLALLLVAALTLNAVRDSIEELGRVTGFNRIAIATMPLSLVDRDDAAVRRHVAALLTGLSGVQGAEATAVVSSPTRLNFESGRVYQPDDAVERDRKKWHFASVRSMSLQGLQVLGVPLLRGRNFDAADSAATSAVAIISEACARTVFGSTDVIGRTLMVDGSNYPDYGHDTLTVVGVSGNTAWLQDSALSAVVYRPIEQRMVPDVALIARGAPENVDRLAGDLRAAARGVDVALPIEFAGRVDVLMGASALAVIGVAKVLSAIALIAIGVTMIGLYGVLSQAVALRRKEMGVRMALGATPRELIALVMRDGLRPVVIGLLAGGGLAALGRLAAQPLLTRTISAIDLPIAIVAVVPLIVAAAIACYVPARRASRIDPMRVLKDL